MGVIIKQSIWTTINSYLGILIGYFSQLFLFPYFLDVEQVGLYRQIQSAALLIAPFAVFGLGAAKVKYNPQQRNQGHEPNFNAYLFIFLTGILSLITVLYLLFRDNITELFNENSPQVNDNLNVIFVLTILYTYLILTESFSKSNFKIIFPGFVKDILIRCFSAAVVTLYGTGFISFQQAIKSLLINYGLALTLLLLYIGFNGYLKFRVDFPKFKSIYKHTKSYMFFAFISAAGSSIVLNIDIQMVTALIGLDSTAIYTTAFYIAVVIEIPRRAIAQIASPLISESITKSDYKAIDKFYKSVSINQSLLGILIFIGIISNLSSLYDIMPNGEIYEAGFYVVLFIGLAKLFDMIFSVNGEIIMMSKYYRFNVISILILAIVVITLNFILIPTYGLVGAAIASLIALFFFNLIKMVFVLIKFNISPFTFKHLYLFAIGFIVYIISILIPSTSNAIIDILLKSACISIIYLATTYLLNISHEFNQLVTSFIKRIFNS